MGKKNNQSPFVSYRQGNSNSWVKCFCKYKHVFSLGLEWPCLYLTMVIDPISLWHGAYIKDLAANRKEWPVMWLWVSSLIIPVGLNHKTG